MPALLLLVSLVFAQPPPSGQDGDCDRRGPPHAQLLDNLDALGVDAETALLMRAAAADHRAELDALGGPQALAQDELRTMGRGLMEELMGYLDDDQRLAARELLPPPPADGPGRGVR